MSRDPSQLHVALLQWLDEQANVGIFTTDETLTIRSWNGWLARKTNIPRRTAVGRPVLQVQSELMGAELERHLVSALQGQPSFLSHHFHGHLLKIASNGRPMAQSGVVAPLRFDNAIVGTVTVIEDVTERVRREAELRRAQERLESTVQERTRELAAEVVERRAAEERLGQLMRHLLSTQEDERRRVARDLHDHLGQHMTALHLKLEVLRRSGPADHDWQEGFTAAQDYLREFERELDAFTSELRMGGLYTLGLLPALADLVDRWSATYGIVARFEAIGFRDARLPVDIETNLYRIVQEALTNVAKHAQARSVSVVLQCRGGKVVLSVEDDGAGFDAVALDLRRGGLTGIRERAALLNGSAQIESSPGAGTTIIVTVPADRRAV